MAIRSHVVMLMPDAAAGAARGRRRGSRWGAAGSPPRASREPPLR
jgi:hypothetical protein